MANQENADQLFANLVADAGNWGGTPLFGEDGTYKAVLGYREDRGLLTQLKRRGLVETFTDRRCLFVSFTKAGAAEAEKIRPGFQERFCFAIG